MKDECADKIPLSECERGRVYVISSRNLGDRGVFNGVDGFIGIREKFGRKYLDTETHYDASEQYGTATPIKATEHSAPAGLSLQEGAVDHRLFDFIDRLNPSYEADTVKLLFSHCVKCKSRVRRDSLHTCSPKNAT